MDAIGTGMDLGKKLIGSISNVEKKIGDAGEGGVGNALQTFGSMLKDQLGNINDLQSKANAAQQSYATGGDVELHNVILATEKSELSLQLASQVRNKIVAAYSEISHMGV